MLDKLFARIHDHLDQHTAAVIEQRAHIERERAGDTARQHAGREFHNAEGYTTPLPKAAQNAQLVYARARRAFEEKGGIEAASLFIAMVVAREKRDDAREALRRHDAEEELRGKTRIHGEVRPHYADLFNRGVEPRHLASMRESTRAIMADMIRWDGEDPNGVDPDNPMPAIVAIYSTRLLPEPGQVGASGRSRPAAAISVELPEVSGIHEGTGPTLIQQELSMPADSQEASSLETRLVRAPDSSTVAANERTSDASLNKARTIESVQPQTAELASVQAPLGPRVMPIAEADEYALPARFSSDQERELRSKAIWWIKDDGETEIDLAAVANFSLPRLTEREIIERVRAATPPRSATPFRYFIETAEVHGVAAGRAAYREATIRRVMLEIATSPDFAEVRARTGLE